jgi:RNA polymerase sigma-70 factor (ECF subfamily)
VKETRDDDVLQETRARRSLTDEELAQLARDGNQDAFAALVERHQHRMFGLALHLLRDPDEAADAAQEAFVRCYTSLGSFDHRLSFGAWLYRIAYNHCLDILRKRRHLADPRLRRAGAADPVASAPDPAPGVEEQVTTHEAVVDVGEALQRISSDHRDILTLRYTAGLSYRQIAEVLGVPESTVTMRLHHAKAALRRQLEPQQEGHRAAP